MLDPKAAVFRLAWALARPLREYLRRTPPHRTRGLVEAALVGALLPLAPETFVAPLPSGGTIELRYRERIGLSTLLNGPFESAEVDALCRHARPGTTVVDAGANVGIFTIPLAMSVGREGHVLAFEPTRDTADRLRENLRRNELSNVEVFDCALGSARTRMTLRLEDDGAFNSLADEPEGFGPTVAVNRLDDIWEDAGRPPVSVVKIDVEGAEIEVLKGAQALLRSSQPVVLLEAADRPGREALSAWLSGMGYSRSSNPGFQPWNHLFVPAATPEQPPGPPARALS